MYRESHINMFTRTFATTNIMLNRKLFYYNIWQKRQYHKNHMIKNIFFLCFLLSFPF